MTTFFLMYVFVWVVYNLLIFTRFGLLGSVSESHLKLKKLNPKYGIIFTLFSWLYALPAMIIAETGLMFFAGGFICLVGVAANYKQGLDKIWHGRFAISAVLLSQISINFDFHNYFISLISILLMMIIFLFRKKLESYIYWIEQVSWLAVGVVLYINKIV